MNLHSSVKITGALNIKKINLANEIVSEINVPNLVVNVGKTYIANRIKDNTTDAMSHMAYGDGATPSEVGNTTLVSELDRQELASVEVSGVNVVFAAVFPTGSGDIIIREAGIFNSDTAGDMLCRTTFPPISKLDTDVIAISWTVTVG